MMKQSPAHKEKLRADVEKRRIQVAARKMLEGGQYLRKLAEMGAKNQRFYIEMALNTDILRINLVERLVDLVEAQE